MLQVNDSTKMMSPEGSVYRERVVLAQSKRHIGIS